ncbi:MAG: T9SS type A sorting domain-containing protein [Flavobacteriales bacterium]|nr:T9SS type A sorting domain-containing protein [Flavobacteriales bacterium]
MRIPLLCLATAFTLAAMGQVPSYVPLIGLVAWYPLDNSATDAGPNALNGTAYSVNAAADRFGNPAGASAFGGVSSYIVVPTNTLFNTGIGLTVTAWVKLSNTGMNQKIIGRTNNSLNSGFVLGVETGYLHPELWSGSGTHDFSAGAVSPNTWEQIALTWDTNGSMAVYVNGVYISGPAGPMPMVDNSEPLIIGGSPWSQSPLYFPVNGNIDDIGIWDRKLSPAELLDVYNSVSTGIAPLDQGAELTLYPNPAGSSVSITSGPDMAGQPYLIIDATGRTVGQGTLDNALTSVGVETLSSGVYTVRVGDANANVLKLVKQ